MGKFYYDTETGFTFMAERPDQEIVFGDKGEPLASAAVKKEADEWKKEKNRRSKNEKNHYDTTVDGSGSKAVLLSQPLTFSFPSERESRVNLSRDTNNVYIDIKEGDNWNTAVIPYRKFKAMVDEWEPHQKPSEIKL